MKYQLVIFDWDGTLADSVDHIVQSMQRAALACELPALEAGAVQNIIGLGLPEAIATLYPELDEAEAIAMRQAYSDYFVQQPMRTDDLFQGAEAMLRRLHANEAIKLAVATGKSRRGLDRVLRDTGLTDCFHATRCADETRSKPHPLMLEALLDELEMRPEQAVMVGDTEYDMAMAAAIGMDRIGVDYGVHSVDRLQSHGPIACVSDIRDVQALIGLADS